MKKIYIYTLSTLLLWGAASCTKPSEFGRTNNDPTAITVGVPAALLANVENNVGAWASAGNGTVGSYAIAGGQYAQYFSETQYPGTSTYALPQVSFAAQYNGDLNDLQTVINMNPDKSTVAAAKILQQYLYWILTDSFGDIPYSQALTGLKSITPAYDKQEDIYKGMLSTLASAVASFDSNPVQGDLFYGGSSAAWKKVGNSLIMLIAIQASKADDNAFAKSAFAAAVASNNFIASSGDNFAIKYPGGSFKDPWWAIYDGRTDYAESKTMTDLTASTNDTRTTVFGGSFLDPAAQAGGKVTSNVGIPAGLSRNDVLAFTAANQGYALVLRADQRTIDGTVTVISAAETLLAKAEGESIGWASGDANADYKEGIRQSFLQWGLAEPAASFYTQANVAFNAKNLAVQQYLAAYPDGHMGWNIWRKTGYPTLIPASGATNSSGQIVSRMVYATSEFQTNGVSVAAAIKRETGTNPGTDSQDNFVWWDKGAGRVFK